MKLWCAYVSDPNAPFDPAAHRREADVIDLEPTQWQRVGAELCEQQEVSDEEWRRRRKAVSILWDEFYTKPRKPEKPAVPIEGANRRARRAAMAKAKARKAVAA